MRKRIFTMLVCMMLLILPLSIYAAPDNTGGTGGNGGSDTAALAREKRVIIKANLQELAGLRQQLKLKINEQKTLLNQYRTRTELKLTTQEREQLQTKINAMSTVKTKLGSALSNAVQAKTQYKNDNSAGKLSGLDKVIASQQIRIQLLKDAIAAL